MDTIQNTTESISQDNSGVFTYRGRPEEVAMNKYQLEIELRDAKHVTFGDCLPWFASALAFLLPLATTTEYHDFLGVKAVWWPGFQLAFGVVILIYTGVIFVKAWQKRNRKTPAQRVEEICRELMETVPNKQNKPN